MRYELAYYEWAAIKPMLPLRVRASLSRSWRSILALGFGNGNKRIRFEPRQT